MGRSLKGLIQHSDHGPAVRGYTGRLAQERIEASTGKAHSPRGNTAAEALHTSYKRWAILPSRLAGPR